MKPKEFGITPNRGNMGEQLGRSDIVPPREAVVDPRILGRSTAFPLIDHSAMPRDVVRVGDGSRDGLPTEGADNKPAAAQIWRPTASGQEMLGADRETSTEIQRVHTEVSPQLSTEVRGNVDRLPKATVMKNHESAVEQMRRVGREVGGPTGYCWPYASAFASGKEVPFLIGVRDSDSFYSDVMAGIFEHPVHHESDNPVALIPGILEATDVGIASVFVRGISAEDGVGHRMVIVPTEEVVDGEMRREYHVGDSLAANGIATYATPEGAMEHVQRQAFEPRSLCLSIQPSQREITAREFPEDEEPVEETMILFPGVSVEMPITRETSQPREIVKED